MSAQIVQELKARGVAEVIVILKPVTTARSLARYFVSSEMSQQRAVSQVTGIRARSRDGGRAETRAPRPARYYEHLGVMLGHVTREGLASLRADPRVLAVTGALPLSPIRPRRVEPARAVQKVTWGITALNVPALWKDGLTGRDVLIGHLDTGADARHPALAGAIRWFEEFDLLGRPRRPQPRPYDPDGHGTHTAATIAGRPVRGRTVGIAPGAHLASAIVIEGGDVVARVLGGMDWAVEHRVRVLNMSLGFRGWWEDFQPLTRLLRSLNILPVFAVGNEGPGTSRSPGNYREALSVGACDDDGGVPDFSSSQRLRRLRDPIVPDLVAPGVDVISAAPGTGYQMMDGTSMATPHVAGLAALLIEARPEATETQVERAILRSCALRRGMSRDRAGHGIPDARLALDILMKAR